DHKMLIDALANLKDLNWSLDLVGDGPLMEDVREQARVLNIINRIKFLGRRWDVAELMSSADVFILTSFWEGFPRSIIEAMRAGLPVVASDVAGVSEAVIDDLTGYLIKDRNRNELENKLSVLIANPDQRMRLGEAGRKRYEELFTFEQMANKTLNLYNQTLKIKN
ncbi:MAG TPA: glycosyltransferase, partial [Niabella sp.]|nr:glycosyltransferase [Niabella sp.]